MVNVTSFHASRLFPPFQLLSHCSFSLTVHDMVLKIIDVHEHTPMSSFLSSTWNVFLLQALICLSHIPHPEDGLSTNPLRQSCSSLLCSHSPLCTKHSHISSELNEISGYTWSPDFKTNSRAQSAFSFFFSGRVMWYVGS